MRPDKRAKTDWAALTHERRMDDWSDGVGEAGVFVPGLMGAGIILSAALLASDGVRRLLPNIGVRRKVNVARGVRHIVLSTASAAGLEVHARAMRRRGPRSAWFYVVTAAVALSLGYLAVRFGLESFNNRGALEGNAMGAVLGMIAGVALAGVTAAALMALLLATRPNRPGRWLVESTPLGRLLPPPESRVERARLLVPTFQQGDEQ